MLNEEGPVENLPPSDAREIETELSIGRGRGGRDMHRARFGVGITGLSIAVKSRTFSFADI